MKYYLIIFTFLISCSNSGNPKLKTKNQSSIAPSVQSKHFSPLRNDNLKHQTFTAKVIRIIDGDTMDVLYENSPVRIRFAHIDCPEKRGKQPFGNNAKLELSDLCFGQNVTIQGENYDRNNRLIAVVINDKDQVVNQEMVRLGMAWHFKKYSKDQAYADLEIEARKNKIGLWQDPNPTPPWLWRKPKNSINAMK